VYCNCDDPKTSNFFHYFSHNFEHLDLKKLITTCYKNTNLDLFSKNDAERAIYLEYTGDKNRNRIPDIEEIEVHNLEGDGDFRSDECIELLKKTDIAVTNPPFSLFREYVDQLMKYNKKFLIVGNMNAITYKEIFKLIKENKLWLGYGPRISTFNTPNGIKMVSGMWFTNLNHSKRYQELILYKQYNPEDYPKYDNYNAINVNKVADIPKDYDGVMGVPVSFLEKYNPNQFEIVGIDRPLITELTGKQSRFRINGKEIYARVVIRNRKLQS